VHAQPAALAWLQVARGNKIVIDADGIEVPISNPDKVLFPALGHTKLDLVRYYLAVAPGALRGSGGRPHQLVRYPNGIAADHFYQKRAPPSRPAWVDTIVLKFPSGRQAEEVVPRNAATLAWMANLACLELHPHAVRAEDLDHPDELRIDLDPVPGVEWDTIVKVGHTVHDTLRDLGLRGWPKTSGSRGLHVLVRIKPRWGFDDVRKAALALAREVERRLPDLASSAWWKEERHGVFLDYNQNAKDRTTAAAYSVRPRPDARVSAPITWDELSHCDPAAFTLTTMPDRFEQVGDRHEGIDESVGTLDALLELSRLQAELGQGEAPWPPHYKKQAGEPPRTAPSRARGRTATERRRAAHPLVEIARACREPDALAGLERWKSRHSDLLQYLEPADVLVDHMRGRHRTWTRVRIDLRHVPDDLRPAPEPRDPDEDVSSV
jgi:bifunctional non-homologous end joining protein LigD